MGSEAGAGTPSCAAAPETRLVSQSHCKLEFLLVVLVSWWVLVDAPACSEIFCLKQRGELCQGHGDV